MTLNDVRAATAAGKMLEIELHAIEQVMYVPFVRVSGQLEPLRDRRNDSLKFPSRFRALQVLAKTGLDTVMFVHRTSYAEMVGAPADDGASEMRQPLAIASFRDD